MTPTAHDVKPPMEVRIPLSTLFDSAPRDAPACAAPLRVDEALDRLQREAVEGICDTGRYRMPFYAWGEGPVMAFVPGLADDRFSVAMAISRLSRHFCCVAYDLPSGRGDGARLGRITHANLVDDLLALLDKLRVGRGYLYGSSFGSTVVLAAAHAQPQRVERLILQGGMALRPLAVGENLLAAFARWWPWDMHALPLRDRILMLTHSEPFRRQPPQTWEFFLTRCGAPPMAAVAWRARILHHLDLRPILPRIATPTLIICGEHDPLVGKECERDLLQGLPHVTRAEIEGCGHLPQYSHPEILAEIIERYLGVKDHCEAAH